MKNFRYIFLLFILAGTFSSCYYDIEEELYPAYSLNSCDTTDISFAQDIEPMLRTACYTCHGSGIGLGNVTLEGYSNLQTYISNGSLLGSVEHSAGFSAMPKGGTKMSDCSISILKVWIRQGASNN